MSGFLDGIRVLDLSEHGPATRAARVLADYGAFVAKLRRPAGQLEVDPPVSAYGGGRGFLPIRVDLRRMEGQATARRLAAASDVVLESYRPGVAKRLGIDYDAVRALNSRVIYAAISGYGASGPYASWAGHDLNYVGMTGLLTSVDGVPRVPGATTGDGAGGGLHAVIAVLAALQARHRTGEGRYLDVSTADGSLWLTSLMVDQEMAAERREGDLAILRGRFACYAAYVASDGKWLTVAAIEARFWKALCDAIGRPEWTAWHRDAARQDELRTGLAAIFATRDRDDWVRELAPKDCCVGPVHGYGDVWNDPHFRARNAVPAPRPGAQVGALFAGADRRDLPQGEGDPVERLFAEAGFSAAELRSLRQAGVVT